MHNDTELTAVMVRDLLRAEAAPLRATQSARYFKTGPGQYGADDVFLGVSVPRQRQIARQFRLLPPDEVEALLQSAEHECRLTALLIWTLQAAKAPPATRADLAARYLRLRAFVNSWDLVDVSAPLLLGQWLLPQTDRHLLDELAAEPHLWSQRIAVLATQPLIRAGQFADTLRLARTLLAHPHDLMHKAVGWMLRDIGDRDAATLTAFLNQHVRQMPRTMLRYAIEHRPAAERQEWLGQKPERRPARSHP